MVSGGVLGFYCLGRRDRAHPENQMFDDIIHPCHGLQEAWHELVNEVMADTSRIIHDFLVTRCVLLTGAFEFM